MKPETIRMEGNRQYMAALVGGQLSAVTFVRDYIQLHFDGPTISAFTLPTVIIGESTCSQANPGYRDALCARIGSTITDAYVDPGERLQIDFSDGSSVVISLRPADRVVAEAAVYSDMQTKEWASW